MEHEKKKVTVIIPTYNAEKFVPALLKGLNEQSLCDFQMIVVDSSSTDKTVQLIESKADILLQIDPKDFDHGGTRTLAASYATGDIIVFLTQDAVLSDKDSLRNIVLSFEDESIGAAYGRQLSYENTNLFGKHLREFNYPNTSEIRNKKDKKRLGIKTAQLSNSFAAYRKSVFASLGGFPEKLILGEDVYLGGKIINEDFNIAYVADAPVIHSHSYSIAEDFKRYFDIGVFHQMEKWLIEDFGKPTGEGKRYVISELNFIIKNKAFTLFPQFLIRNGAKFIGYKLGTKYKRVPMKLIKKMSMHWRWWEKYNST